MGRAFIVAVIVWFVGQQATIKNLSDLTLPSSAICHPTLTPFLRQENNRMLVGLWGNLPITTNPWTGTDRTVMIDLHESLIQSVVLPALVIPDPPSINRRELAIFKQALADGVEQGYAAFYDTNEGGQVFVYALTMRTIYSALHARPDIVPFRLDGTYGMIGGKLGACRDAIVRHIKSIGGTIQE